MADACALATYRQLAWTSGWHLREETYLFGSGTFLGSGTLGD
jgi:hypothetical protein